MAKLKVEQAIHLITDSRRELDREKWLPIEILPNLIGNNTTYRVYDLRYYDVLMQYDYKIFGTRHRGADFMLLPYAVNCDRIWRSFCEIVRKYNLIKTGDEDRWTHVINLRGCNLGICLKPTITGFSESAWWYRRERMKNAGGPEDWIVLKDDAELVNTIEPLIESVKRVDAIKYQSSVVYQLNAQRFERVSLTLFNGMKIPLRLVHDFAYLISNLTTMCQHMAFEKGAKRGDTLVIPGTSYTLEHSECRDLYFWKPYESYIRTLPGTACTGSLPTESEK